MLDAQTRAAVEDLLRFYCDAGIDFAVEEFAPDRFVEAAARRAEVARLQAEAEFSDPTARLPPEVPAAPPSEDIGGKSNAQPSGRSAPAVALPSAQTVMAAREAAGTAATLDELRAVLGGFEGCNLRFTATNLVFGDGNPLARVMLVGEAPGLEEDLQSLPFVGKSGQLLDRMLAAIGLDRSSVYIANVVPWRPPGNRKPTPQETEICRPFVERQITLVDPDLLVLLGDASAKQLLQTTTGISKLRGRWQPYRTGQREIRAMATFHPAYLLRTPLAKRLVWRDLLTVKAALEARPNVGD